jgi:para-nitrobenzyl esterase
MMQNQPHTITTNRGAITGLVSPSGACEFLGIPFATAQRLEKPIDISSWDDNFDATSYGSICPQTPGMLEIALNMDASLMKEDCLNLNVFTPRTPTEGMALPVLVWIHGGAYTNGAGSVSAYHGESLASKETVVVTINYRLGPLGFLGDGNYGIHDMLSALRWVQRNISVFGGNEKNVTMFGESAGGSAIISLLSSPEIEGLAHKAWVMSPSIGQLRDQPRAIELQEQFLQLAGLKSIEDVKLMSVAEILATQQKQMTTETKVFDFYSPTAGASSLSDDILGEAARSPIPLVVGTNRDENRLWSAFDESLINADLSRWEEYTLEIFGERAQLARDVYQALRPGESVGELMSAVSTDTGFRQPAQRLCENRVASNTPTWMYWFTWPTPAFGGVVGCCHALDIPFAFNNLHSEGVSTLTGDGVERAGIADRFSSEIIAFASHGHPSWSQFNINDRPTLVINAQTELLQDPEPEIRSLYV